uniref:Soluble scavenger receptor cysteine-rich domain-containing protein SSC5D n=1 Tax=Callorhinchus milii TaxID=7868 RepID=A0A4W3GGL7_CALMI
MVIFWVETPIVYESVRLVNGGSRCAGRVEVYYGGQWGTVFGDGFRDSGWDMLDAAVVCKEFGSGAALSASGGAHFGKGSGPVSTLRDCQSQPWGGRYSWPHNYDAGVICSGKYFSLRSFFFSHIFGKLPIEEHC